MEGCLEIGAEPVDSAVWKITVRIFNRSLVPADSLEDQDAVLMRTLRFHSHDSAS